MAMIISCRGKLAVAYACMLFQIIGKVYGLQCGVESGPPGLSLLPLQTATSQVSSRALQFSGGNGHVALPTMRSWGSSDGLSFSVWIYIEKWPSNMVRIFDFGNRLANCYYPWAEGLDNVLLAFQSNGLIKFHVLRGSAQEPPMGYYRSFPGIPTGQWTHIALTISKNLGSGRSRNVGWYLNGVLRTWLEDLNFDIPAVPRGNLFLGRSAWDCDPGADGGLRLADFKMFSKELAMSEVTAMQIRDNFVHSAMLLWYPLNETISSGATAHDCLSRGPTAILSGSPMPSWVPADQSSFTPCSATHNSIQFLDTCNTRGLMGNIANTKSLYAPDTYALTYKFYVTSTRVLNITTCSPLTDFEQRQSPSMVKDICPGSVNVNQKDSLYMWSEDSSCSAGSFGRTTTMVASPGYLYTLDIAASSQEPGWILKGTFALTIEDSTCSCTMPRPAISKPSPAPLLACRSVPPNVCPGVDGYARLPEIDTCNNATKSGSNVNTKSLLYSAYYASEYLFTVATARTISATICPKFASWVLLAKGCTKDDYIQLAQVEPAAGSCQSMTLVALPGVVYFLSIEGLSVGDEGNFTLGITDSSGVCPCARVSTSPALSTPSPSPTPAPAVTPTSTPSPSPSATATASISPTPSQTPVRQPIANNSATPTPTFTPRPLPVAIIRISLSLDLDFERWNGLLATVFNTDLALALNISETRIAILSAERGSVKLIAGIADGAINSVERTAMDVGAAIQKDPTSLKLRNFVVIQGSLFVEVVRAIVDSQPAATPDNGQTQASTSTSRSSLLPTAGIYGLAFGGAALLAVALYMSIAAAALVARRRWHQLPLEEAGKKEMFEGLFEPIFEDVDSEGEVGGLRAEGQHIPRYWSADAASTSGARSLQLRVPASFEEVDAVQKAMHKTIRQHRGALGGTFDHLTVKRVERLEDISKWTRYRAAIEILERKERPTRMRPLETSNELLDRRLLREMNEAYLFHGFPLDLLPKILRDGLDFRDAKLKSAGMFGAGIYFAELCSKSNQYCHREGCDGRCHSREALAAGRSCSQAPPGTEFALLLCRVLLGDAFRTEVAMNELRKPPEKPPPSTERFDSVHGVASSSQRTNSVRYDEFIVYDNAQVYPEFIIFFTRDSIRMPASSLSGKGAEAPRAAASIASLAQLLRSPLLRAGGLQLASRAPALSVHILDSSGTWSSPAALGLPRATASPALVCNFLFGAGGARRGEPTAAGFALDLSTGLPVELPPLPVPRALAVLAPVTGGLLVIGGITNKSGGKPSARVDRYEYPPGSPAGGRWAEDAPLLKARRSFALCRDTGTGDLYVSGGIVEADGGRLALTNSVERYDAARRCWVPAPSMANARAGHCSVAAGGNIFVMCGHDYAGRYFASVESYDPAQAGTNSWAPCAPLPCGRRGACCAATGGVIYIAGGQGPSGPHDTFDAYDIARNEWCQVGSIPGGCSCRNASLLELPT